jgi:erythromycin esterase-like protein
LLIGFTTYTGTVTAARDWGRPAEVRRVTPALPGSCESLFHETGVPDFLLFPEALKPEGLDAPLLQRAIGVVYRPESERLSHYFRVQLASQFDAVLHLDRTQALEPLERSARWDRDEPAETYPSGL